MIEHNAKLIEQALEVVLQSHSFRTSKQCQSLLQYIVKHTLDQHEEMLRERVIGAEVFERAPDYDTGNDPIVRSRAAEVRKRLAQHYMHEGGTQCGVRIDIPCGSYQATFEMREEPVAPSHSVVTVMKSESPLNIRSFVSVAPMIEAPIAEKPETQAPNRWRAWRRGFVAAGILTIAVLAIAWTINDQREKTFNCFWGPITDSARPVVVYFGGSYFFHLSPNFLQNHQSNHRPQDAGPAVIDAIQNGQALNETSLIPQNPNIGYGDVAAVARVASTLTRLGKKYDLRYGSDITATDLRASPAILIGGFSNIWSLQLMRNFRYALDQGGIVDQQQHKLLWTQSGSADGLSNDDYVVVSRIPNEATGNFTLIIAGLNTFSNQAAADLICDPTKLRVALRSMNDGWEKKNLQLVLRVGVVKQVPISSEIVAVYSW
jgi:hypothetical protein